MSKLKSTQKTMAAIAAAGALTWSQVAMAGVPVNPPGSCDTGVVRTVGPALVWALNTDGSQVSNILFPFGTAATDAPVVGDWDDSGTDDVGIVRTKGNANQWRLDTDGDGTANEIRTYGASGNTPVSGRFVDGNAAPVLGQTRTSNNGNALVWQLDTNNDGTTGLRLKFGKPGDTPIVGDWDGDGTDNVGVIRVVNNQNKFLLDTDGGGKAEIVRVFGKATDIGLICDWNGDNVASATAVRATGVTSLFWSKDTANNGGTGETSTNYGRLVGDTPVAGDWDGM